jgi:hypothetical protein
VLRWPQDKHVTVAAFRIPVFDAPEAALERALMEEYLSDHELTLDDLESFDDDERDHLMLEAAAYAALRVSERVFGS